MLLGCNSSCSGVERKRRVVNNFSALQRDGLLYFNFLKPYDLLFCEQISLNKILIFEKYTVPFREGVR